MLPMPKKYGEFIDALVNDKDVPVGGRDGLLSLVIGLAAKKSLAEGRSVQLNEIM